MSQKEVANERIITRWGTKIHVNQGSLKAESKVSGQRVSVRDTWILEKINVNTVLKMYLQNIYIALVNA